MGREGNRKLLSMNRLEELNLLIDRASQIAGSDRKLALLLGEPPQRVSNWRHGHAVAQPEDWALLAHVAGLDPVSELTRAIVAKHESKRKGDLLMKALGKASLVTGAVLGSVGASAHQISSMIPAGLTWTNAAEWIAGIYTMCIMLNRARRVRRVVARGIKRLWQSLVHGMPEPLPANQSVQPEKDQKDNSRATAIPRAPLAAGA